MTTIAAPAAYWRIIQWLVTESQWLNARSRTAWAQPITPPILLSALAARRWLVKQKVLLISNHRFGRSLWVPNAVKQLSITAAFWKNVVRHHPRICRNLTSSIDWAWRPAVAADAPMVGPLLPIAGLPFPRRTVLRSRNRQSYLAVFHGAGGGARVGRVRPRRRSLRGAETPADATGEAFYDRICRGNRFRSCSPGVCCRLWTKSVVPRSARC